MYFFLLYFLYLAPCTFSHSSTFNWFFSVFFCWTAKILARTRWIALRSKSHRMKYLYYISFFLSIAFVILSFFVQVLTAKARRIEFVISKYVFCTRLFVCRSGQKKENTIVHGYSPSMDFSGLIAFHSPSWDRNNLVPNFLFISYERRRALFGFSHFS